MWPCGGHEALQDTQSGCEYAVYRETAHSKYVPLGLVGCYYLSNDLRRLGVVDSLEILLHGRIIVLLLVEEVAVFAIDHVLLRGINSEFLCEVDGEHKKIALVQQIELLLERLFVIAVNLFRLAYARNVQAAGASYFAVNRQDEEIAPLLEDGLDL